MIYASLLLLLFLFHQSLQEDDNCLTVNTIEVEGRPSIPSWYSEVNIVTSECQNPCRSVNDFHDSYNLIEIKKHLLWLRRTKEKYIFCCKAPFNCSKVEIIKEMFAFISEKQKRIPTVRFENEPFNKFWILIVIGCVFSVTVILHVTVSLYFICSFQKKKTEEASVEKFEHDSAALVEQNAVLPGLFPSKIPNTSMYGSSKIAEKESEQLTEKTAICDEDTLIEWTKSEAQKDYNQKAAVIRKQAQKNITTAIATTPQEEPALELQNTQLSSQSTQASLSSTSVDKTQSESVRKRNV